MNRALLAVAAGMIVLAAASAVRADEAADREAVVRRLLERSTLLEDTHFTVPVEFYRQWLRRVAEDAGQEVLPPVDYVDQLADYRLAVPAEGPPTLTVTRRLHIFRPRNCRNLPLLSSELSWRKVTVNGQAAELTPLNGWLCLSPAESGQVEVVAEAALRSGNGSGGQKSIRVRPAVRNTLEFESPQAWEVRADGAIGNLVGAAEQGTRGRLPLKPAETLNVVYERPRVKYERAPRYEVRGDVAWNFDAASQQLVANLVVTVADGRSDQIDLLLPPAADRVVVTGPDVREVRSSSGAARVFLRQKISGATRLEVRCELPIRQGGLQSLAHPSVRDGQWTDGTLVLTSTAGGNEVVPESTSGLNPLALVDVGESASAILAGKAVLAYRIAGRSFKADVAILDLSAYALRETLADTAHWELLLRGDGTVLCKAAFEIRNRTRQFLEVTLPKGAVVLAARVNEQTRPMTVVPDRSDVYLLPMERSTVSVEGLISFPVEIVCLYRIGGLGPQRMALPVPQIDLPIAYAWAELYAPGNLSRPRWSGPLECVDEYASKTATATLGYGRGEKAAGADQFREADLPDASAPPVAEGPQTGFGSSVTVGGAAMPDSSLLARNYYRAGKDFYDKGDFDKAVEAFNKTIELAPESVYAGNAKLYALNTSTSAMAYQADSASKKAAIQQVKEDFSALNAGLVEQQRQFLEQGRQVVRAGDAAEAVGQFRAAKALGEKLVARGESEREQKALLREVDERLAEADRSVAAQTEQLWARVDQLKSEGRYEDALGVVHQMRSTVQTQGGGQSVRRREAISLGEDTDGDRVAKEIAELSVKAVQTQSFRGYDKQAEARRLWQAAMQRIDARDYSGAVGILDSLLAADPQNERARRLRDDATYLAGLSASVQARLDKRRQSTGDVKESAIPWYQIYTYPDTAEWESLTQRRAQMLQDTEKTVELRDLTPALREKLSRYGIVQGQKGLRDIAGAETSGEGEAAAQVRERLTYKGMIGDQNWSMRLSFQDASLRDVLTYVREVARQTPHRVNMVVDYDGIEAAGVDLEGTLTIDQRDISLRQALQMVVGRELAYFINNDGTVVLTARQEGGALPDTGPVVPRMRLEGADELVEAVQGLDASHKRLMRIERSGPAQAPRDRVVQEQVLEGRGGGGGQPPSARPGRSRTSSSTRPIPAFHGDRSTVLHRVDGDVEQARSLVIDLLHAAPGGPVTKPGIDDGRPTVAISNNNLVVSGTAEHQRQVEALLKKLEAAKGPQVEIGANIITQRARKILPEEGQPGPGYFSAEAQPNWAGTGQETDSGFNASAAGRGLVTTRDQPTWFSQPSTAQSEPSVPILSNVPVVGRLFSTDGNLAGKVAEDAQFQDFIRRNYKWATDGQAQAQAQTGQTGQRRSGGATDSSFGYRAANEVSLNITSGWTPSPWKAPQTGEAYDGSLDDGGIGSGGLDGRSARGRGGNAGFFGVGARASSLAFVVDNTGSMTDSIMYVKTELKRMIGMLRPSQQFSVSPSNGKALAGGKLLPATEANKQAAFEFIDNLVPMGQGQMDRALERGLTSKPELMYLLTDGELSREAVATVDRLNADHHTTVNTIGFIYSGGEAGLMGIAERHGGVYKYVGEEDLENVGQTAAMGDFRANPIWGSFDEWYKDLRYWVGDGVEHERPEGDTDAGANGLTYHIMGPSDGGWQGETPFDTGVLDLSARYNVNFQGEAAAGFGSAGTAQLPQAARTTTAPLSAEQLKGFLAGKAASNLGQKVPVNSINLNVRAPEIRGLGVDFVHGNNGVNFTVVDEAQVRTLLELDAKQDIERRVVGNNESFQEALVGTDAQFANGWTGNIQFGGEDYNTVNVIGNPINLPHEKYILVDNGRYLTAIRAGQMRHWTEKTEAGDVGFAEVPQTIDVPHVGQLVKFEKRLVKPTDRLVIHCDYVWKGATE